MVLNHFVNLLESMTGVPPSFKLVVKDLYTAGGKSGIGCSTFSSRISAAETKRVTTGHRSTK